MAIRIVGVDLPQNKRGEITLTYIFGIGRKMHEDPQVPNYGRKGNGPMIKSGLCIAIEPMITMGSPKVYMTEDNWTIRTRDGKPSAHFEHTIAVHKGKVEILSSFEDIEKAN